MSTVAKAMAVTVGTLTTAVNNLVKKGYVSRVRSSEDKRVVLLSLTGKGVAAYEKHAAFHARMVQTIMDGFEGSEMDILTRALEKLRRYSGSWASSLSRRRKKGAGPVSRNQV